LFCFILIQTHLFASNTEQADTSYINALTREAYNSARKNPSHSIANAHIALTISNKLAYKKGIADASLALGSAFLTKYNTNDSAHFYYQKALNIYTKTNDLNGLGRTCYGLSFLYNLKSKPHEALQFGKHSVHYFEQAENTKETIAALSAVVYLQRHAGNYEEALALSQKAIKTAHSLNDTLLWANALNDQGQTFKDMCLFNQSIDAYFAAFKLWEEKNDSSGLAIAYGSIANAYFYQEDYQKSLEFNFKKLPLIQKTGNLWERNKTYDNIALSFSNLDQHDSALYYMKQALHLAEEMNFPSGIANSCDKMASTFIKMDKPDSAFVYSAKALAISKKNNDKTYASYLVNFANVLDKKKEYSEALLKATEAHKLATKNRDSHTQRAAALLLSEIYNHLNRKDLAYSYLTEYLKLNENITNKEYMRKVTRLDLQHEYDKKQKAIEHEIELLEKNNLLKSAKLHRSWIILGTLIFLTLAVGIISILVIRNKNHHIEQMSLEIRNYLLQLDDLETDEKTESPVKTLVKNYGLTHREAEIMELISTGIGNEEIADKLFVSKNTIKFHIKNIFIKLDVRNRVQALHKMAV
jgi:DNA-binding CsgD family transcriptional regulator